MNIYEAVQKMDIEAFGRFLWAIYTIGQNDHRNGINQENKMLKLVPKMRHETALEKLREPVRKVLAPYRLREEAEI